MRLAAAFAVGAVLVAQAAAMEFGVNTHRGHDPAHNEQVAALLQRRHFTSARMDLMYDRSPQALRDQIGRIRSRGGRAQVVLLIGYHWDDRCNQDLAQVENDAYSQAAGAVRLVADLVEDFELLNETQLRPEIAREVPWNSAGGAVEPYRHKPCLATLAAVLRGMSRAVADARASTGRPLRAILGQVGRDFGFLRFMEQSGVRFDVIGHHAYPRADNPAQGRDPWYGRGGLFGQLAAFGRPVQVNEFNCGEIYDARYSDTPGAPGSQACLQSLARHLKGLLAQRAVTIESVHFYELLDEPWKKAPENRFGLMVDLGRPKPQLALATAFAGGRLSAEERREITSRGLLSEADIDALRRANGPKEPGSP